MRKLTEKQRILITATLAVIPTLGVCGLLYRDHEEWRKAQTDLQRVQEELDCKNADIETIPRMKREMDEHASQFAEHLETLPSAKELDDLLRDLEELARRSSIDSIDHVSPIRTRSSAGRQIRRAFVPHQYSMSFLANYRKVADFIDALETNRRFLAITSFKITPVPEGQRAGSEGDDLAVQLEIVTYSYAETIESDLYRPGVSGTRRVSQSEAEEDRHVSRRGWRDPFASQLTPKQDSRETDGPDDPPPPPIEDEIQAQRRFLDGVRRALKVLRVAYRNNRHAATITALEAFEGTWAGAAVLTTPTLAGEGSGYHRQFLEIRGLVTTQTAYLREWASLCLQRIEERFRAADRSGRIDGYYGVVAAHDEMCATLEEYLGDRQGSEVQSIVARADECAGRARTRLEFYDLPLQVVGVAYLHAPARRRESRAVVIYDGVSREVDLLQWRDIPENRDLRVHVVVEDGVVFRFKGELIRLRTWEPPQAQVLPARTPGPGRAFGPGSRGNR